MIENLERNELVKMSQRFLTASEFQTLAEVPPEVEWFANIENENTRRAYRGDVQEFMSFAGIHQAEEFRMVKRSHLIAWRKQLEARTLEAATVRRKLSAVASLFDYLCDANAVPFNPADGVKRPNAGSNEGKSPALGDAEAKAILEAPDNKTLKGLRDRAILSVLLFHGLRRAELCSLAIGDVQSRRGVMHFRVMGKGGKIRFVPVHPHSSQRISEYLERSGHGEKNNNALFRPVKNPAGTLENHSLDTASTKTWCENMPFSSVSIQAQCVCMGCGRPPQQTLSTTRRILRRFRNGSDTRVFQRRVFMTGEKRSRRTPRLSK